MAFAHWLLLIYLALIWGGSFFFVKIILREVGPMTLVFTRAAGAAVLLYLIVQLRGLRMPRDPRVWLLFCVMGALNILIPHNLIAWGQTRIDGGLAAILNATTPLFGVIVAHFATRDERITANRLVGVIIGMAGVALVIGPAALWKVGGALGQVAVLGAALCYAFASVVGRRLKAHPSIVVATGQVVCGALLACAPAMIVEQPWTLPRPGPATIASLAALAVLSTALAYIIYFYLLARVGATNITLVTFLIPVNAILLNGVFLGERLEIHQFAGMGVIALGLLCVDGRVFRRRGAPVSKPRLTDPQTADT
ncbi:MAG: EamA family transporter [Phycisphaerales bacterium]|nr:EamA family transporter [Phycisphaerales bacterium]